VTPSGLFMRCSATLAVLLCRSTCVRAGARVRRGHGSPQVPSQYTNDTTQLISNYEARARLDCCLCALTGRHARIEEHEFAETVANLQVQKSERIICQAMYGIVVMTFLSAGLVPDRCAGPARSKWWREGAHGLGSACRALQLVENRNSDEVLQLEA
jgi:hypothetical protein